MVQLCGVEIRDSCLHGLGSSNAHEECLLAACVTFWLQGIDYVTKSHMQCMNTSIQVFCCPPGQVVLPTLAVEKNHANPRQRNNVLQTE